MRVTITHTIETTSVQKATALREKMAELLADDPDAALIAANTKQDTQTYHVVGYDVFKEESFEEDVEATDSQDAQDQVTTDSKRVVIVGPASMPMPSMISNG